MSEEMSNYVADNKLKRPSGQHHSLRLQDQVRNPKLWPTERWATPTTMDSLPPKSEEALFREATEARPGRSKPANLRDQVSNMDRWPTPTSRDWKDGRKVYDRKKDGTATQDTLGRRLAAMGETVSGALNPMWVEWLMGFPTGWTDLED